MSNQTIYDDAARQAARLLTLRYSSSFGLASRLFGKSIRDDIYTIYGLLRVADEIVDSYRGSDAPQLLTDLERQVTIGLRTGYRSDLIVHAFVQTARRVGIGQDLVRPFFASMAMDLQSNATSAKRFNKQSFERYVYGSAEVVGLMCLKVFCANDQAAYNKLAPGARLLGAAFQKVNFLRDIAEDTALGRRYFPLLQTVVLDESSKQLIIADIDRDFKRVATYIDQLPRSARPAVLASYRYYMALLDVLRVAPAQTILKRRLRISNRRKLVILVGCWLRRYF